MLSYGQTHFIIRKYCDKDFGLNLAERILDPQGLKMKHSQTFTSAGKKDITSYICCIQYALLNYITSDQFHYVKQASAAVAFRYMALPAVISLNGLSEQKIFAPIGFKPKAFTLVKHVKHNAFKCVPGSCAFG